MKKQKVKPTDSSNSEGRALDDSSEYDDDEMKRRMNALIMEEIVVKHQK